MIYPYSEHFKEKNDINEATTRFPVFQDCPDCEVFFILWGERKDFGINEKSVNFDSFI